MTSGRLQDKVAMVTGAGAGIGRAICTRFAVEGAVVVATDIDPDSGEDTARLVREAGGEASYLQLDVRDEDAWKATMDALRQEHGEINVLVNNAGLPYRRLLHESSLEEWTDLMAVNAGGTFLGIKHGGREMSQGGGGSIVNVSSAAALVGVTGMTSYSAGKGAIRAMSRAAAMELAQAGVRVNSIYPTSVRTSMIESDARDTGISVSEFLEAASALSPLGRIAEPEDVADAALFLASVESRFITGAELVVDGGATGCVG